MKKKRSKGEGSSGDGDAVAAAAATSASGAEDGGAPEVMSEREAAIAQLQEMLQSISVRTDTQLPSLKPCHAAMQP